MNDANLDLFLHISGFSEQDRIDLASLAPLLRDKVPAITDAFYERLLSQPEVARHIEGKLEHLKATHRAWLLDLLSGNCDDAFWERQRQIGRVHVQAKVPPLYVSASMGFLRAEMPRAAEDLADMAEGHMVQRGLSALLRLMDVCQMLIDTAYADERLRRLSDATGMRPALIENLIDLRAA